MNWEEQWFIAKLGCSLLQHFILHNPHLKIIAADFLHAVEFIKVDKKLRNGSLIHVYILYSHDKSATLAGKSCRFHTATKTARKLLHVFRTRSLSALRQTRPPHNVFIAMPQLRPLCHLLKKKRKYLTKDIRTNILPSKFQASANTLLITSSSFTNQTVAAKLDSSLSQPQ